jgi:hypothetical protein
MKPRSSSQPAESDSRRQPAAVTLGCPVARDAHVTVSLPAG